MNKVFIATSLDGYIASKNGGIEWLNSIPNPHNDDLGYEKFISQIDAIVMGRKTFETVCSFGIDWPYKVPVFVLSNNMKQIPIEYSNKIELVNGEPNLILKHINQQGFKNIYIDGGKTIQSFLRLDLIDEITITIIPILLGSGIPLFSEMDKSLQFECVETKIYLDMIVQNRFIRKSS